MGGPPVSRLSVVSSNPPARSRWSLSPNLAGSLNNLSNHLRVSNQKEAALEGIQEAVNIHRFLVQENPQTFNHELAMSLSNLALCLIVLGQPGAALEAIQEAIALYEPLAREYPQAFEENLAMARADLEYIQSTLEPKPPLAP